MSRFEQLGRRIAELQDADRRALRATERSAESFIQALRRKRRHHPTRLLWAASLAMATLPFLAWLVVFRDARLLVEPPSNNVSIGRSIVVPRDQTIPLHFFDGSLLWLASGTRASVREMSPHRANVDIESGKAQVSVVHRIETSWIVRAGPYQVGVTGTKFDLEWSPENDRFVLELKEGSVVVTTEDSSHAAVKMVAPEHLVIDRGVWHLNPLGSGKPSAPGVEQMAEPPAPQRSRPVQSRTPVPSAPVGQPPEASPNDGDWQSLGKQGKYAEAYTQAEVLGIAHWSRMAAPPELLALAEICRFSAHAQQAMSVLTTLRERFPDREEAAIASFQLGRLFGSGARAAEGFRTYLRERPKGALAREAAGRLLEVLDRSGDQAGAVAAAESYLRSYPSGPHAAFARRVLGH